MREFVAAVAGLNSQLNELVWGPAMIAFMMLAGLYFSVGPAFHQPFRLWMAKLCCNFPRQDRAR
jgi:Na+/alanine symporter